MQRKGSKTSERNETDNRSNEMRVAGLRLRKKCYAPRAKILGWARASKGSWVRGSCA
jgi:hypothetical protein